MSMHPISDRLTARAAEMSAEQPTEAAELTKASKKFAGYSRGPGTRREADRIAKLLTPAVVAAVGAALVDLRRREIGGETVLLMSDGDFREGAYALAALLAAAASPELEAAARGPLAELEALVPQMNPKQAEHVQYFTGLYSDVEAGAPLRAAADARLAQEPPTLQQVWAVSVGLDLPSTWWSIAITVPGLLHGEEDSDVTVYTSTEHDPAGAGEWHVRLGFFNTSMLGRDWPRQPPYGTYERKTIAGEIAPALEPGDLPRVLADLEAAHPELTFDRSAVRVAGSPGRLISPAKKKVLRAWVQG
ncbi:hypothetical protein RDV89_19415 [Nocardioides zeae]|uniref:Uncharacterized protein n=1 Tax=Nocardioides imazamoxiresistens TaxID=3231893 RepID=A0ABU3Q179_9ACTN|nr:hypothetical protein [Nocardioides zeae]MDT9595265.1 hypothetical protein [Nocardioides zeae]